MTSRCITGLLVATAVACACVLPAEAAKRTVAKYKSREVRQTAQAWDSDAYYYRGTGAAKLYDRAAPHFASPPRGREFFEAIGNRGGQ